MDIFTPVIFIYIFFTSLFLLKYTFTVKSPRRRVKEPQISHRKCLFIDKELDSDTDVEYTSRYHNTTFLQIIFI